MDYNHLSNELEKASPFDLWRLKCVIDTLLNEPEKQQAIKRHLYPGQAISYFDADQNRLIEATVVQVKQKRVLVQHKNDGEKWTIPFYMVNLVDVDTQIQPQQTNKLDRRSLQVGNLVGWHSKEGFDKYGHIIKLNPKLARIKTTGGEIWGVDYSFLFAVTDGDIADDKVVLTIDNN